MGIVDLAFIRVESSFPLRKPEYIYIKTELNHHGSCKVQAVIDEDIYNENLDMILKIEDFKIIYEPDQKEYILFTGYLEEINVFVEAGLYKITITGVSHSKKTDQIQENHSYQDSSMTYNGLLNKVMGSEGNCILSEGNNRVIGEPFIQFQSTKWGFLCQIAERLCLPIITSCVGEKSDIKIGISKGEIHTLKNIEHQKIIVDCRNWKFSGGDEIPGGTCICYEVETYDFFKLGDWVEFYGLQWMIAKAEFFSKGGLILHRYLLIQETGIPYLYQWERKIRHYSLLGTVLCVQGNQVKLHLDIDKEQKEETAYPYEYYPVTGNLMYAMPEKGARAILNVTENFHGGGIVTGCMPDKDHRSHPRQKRLETTDGRQIFMDMESLLFSSAGQEILALNDRSQTNILSEMSVQIKADRNIQMETNGSVTIGAGVYMHIKQRGTINEIVFSGNEITHRAVRHDYSSGEQSPKRVEEKAEGSAFPSMELAGELFGMFACGNTDPVEKAFMEAQPIAASPDTGKWKKAGVGFGIH